MGFKNRRSCNRRKWSRNKLQHSQGDVNVDDDDNYEEDGNNKICHSGGRKHPYFNSIIDDEHHHPLANDSIHFQTEAVYGLILWEIILNDRLQQEMCILGGTKIIIGGNFLARI